MLTPHIGNLSFLQVLNLLNNSFHGSIPPQIGHLYRLQALVISRNQLEGSIPKEMGLLPNIKGLYLGGTIPPSLGNISTLEEIWLYENLIHGSIPDEIGLLSGITILNFHANNFTGPIPSSLFNMSSLIYLVLYSNDFSGSLPTNMGSMLPNLEELYLWSNQLSGQIPSSLYNASKLTVLELQKNQFNGPVPTSLGHLTALKVLKLNSNHLENGPVSPNLSFIDSLTNCTFLEYLQLGDNLFAGFLPDSIGNLSNNLKTFTLNGCHIKGSIPASIGNLQNLTGLDLSGNSISGRLPSEISRLHKIGALLLYGNKLEGSIPTEFGQLQSLLYLYLNDNMLSGSMPSSINNLTKICDLNLGNNKLSGELPTGIWSEALLEVDLSRNYFSSLLPQLMGHSIMLTQVNFSDNHLFGNLPNSMGNLQYLETLDLSLNSFQGTIPTTFGDMISLKYVDISSNKLSGEIPESLCSVPNLFFLNLSFNGLEGPIPSKGVFTNITADSFSGNPRLCGPPKLRVPACPINTTTPRSRSRSWSWMKSLAFEIPLAIICAFVFSLLCVYLVFFRRHELSVLSDGVSQMKGPGWISYYELRRATDNFNRSTLLGVGSFGSVYKGFLSDGSPAAIKVLNLQREGATKSFHAECRVMQNIRHRNLVKIITVCSNLDFKALVLQFMANGNLERWLYPQDGAHCRLSLLQRLDIVIDVAQALEYLHHSYSVPIIHRDLKPSNILLNEDMTAHVGDFGLARLIGDQNIASQTSTIGTIGYIAPEYGTGSNITTSGDVYSFGVVLFEIFTRKRPTDPMFSNGLSLSKWVDQEHSDGILEVVHGDLLLENDSHNNGSNSKLQYSSSTFKCLSSVMQIGLSCTKERPNERIDMRDAVLKLKDTRSEYMAIVRA
ncbi:putative receptor-like protein kinase At3g47110 isoform X2 [Amborella trichopoda]|uniref:putative receptor-like protein kinase At3g47110 isoform X2 n=1 Tax=Amborella trichopoda TaxID=13333 RepID=UPI0009BFA94A|nr:putative receptor-like protein kinase At3g47110 isoform X2 [Amborella trichopoda]|eukprot:XP_020522687.1 putative receptor-like protein kinase At3g47110 isoform X2 [Amborella trichopoda]